MSRLQQWMNPVSDMSEKNNSFRLRSSNQNPCMTVKQFSSPPQMVESYSFISPCDFSVPPPSMSTKCGMRKPISSKTPYPKVLPMVLPNFSVPPPERTRSFKSSARASPLPFPHNSCLPSSSPPMIGLDKEQHVWQKVLCTVQSAVNHGQAKRELLELLQGIKNTGEECEFNAMVESNNNGFLNYSNPIKTEMTGTLSGRFNVTDSLSKMDLHKIEQAQMPNFGGSGRLNVEQSTDSLPSDILSSSTPSSGSCGVDTTGCLEISKPLPPAGCTFCYAHFKRHCQLQQIKWPRMEEPGHFWNKHSIRDDHGNVTCPELRLKVCEYCLATGSNAHTKRFCPSAGLKR